MAASDFTGQCPSQTPNTQTELDDDLEESSADEQAQASGFHAAQRQATAPTSSNNADALFPLARFKQMYRSPFMCDEEKRKRLHWLEREEQQYLARSYPWHRAQGEELMRYHLAATVIQSEFRAWRARQALRALRGEAELLRQEELARQRQAAVRLLRQQAKDLLLTLYAQGQYGKTRDRLMIAKGGLTSGPSLEDLKIDAQLWDKVRQLGLDPVEVLSGQMTAKQIKLVLNASSIRNSGVIPQRPQDLGLAGAGAGGSRLLNAQDSMLGALTAKAPHGGLGDLLPSRLLSTIQEPGERRLAHTMSDARAGLPLLAGATSLDGLDWLGASRPPPGPAPPRIARRSNPSSLRQPPPPSPPPQASSLFSGDRSSADQLLWRAGTSPLLSLASGTMRVNSTPLPHHAPQHQAHSPPSPKLVQQLHDYQRLPRAARSGVLRLAKAPLHSHSHSHGHGHGFGHFPEPPEVLPAAKKSFWVMSSGSLRTRAGVRDLSASADGPLLGRSSRRPVSMSGNGLQGEQSDGDMLSCAGKGMSRTCRLSESGVNLVNFNLPPLPSFKQ